MKKLPPVYITYDARRKVWVVMFEYNLELPITGDRLGLQFKIPQNFEFDLASIPRILWPLIGSFELSIVAPLIHDYFYATKGAGFHHKAFDSLGESPYPEDRLVTRFFADKLFLELMLMEGVTPWKAKAAYHAVRMFGPRW